MNLGYEQLDEFVVQGLNINISIRIYVVGNIQLNLFFDLTDRTLNVIFALVCLPLWKIQA